MTNEERELLILTAEMTYSLYTYNQAKVVWYSLPWTLFGDRKRTEKGRQQIAEAIKPVRDRLNRLLRILEATEQTEQSTEASPPSQ